MKDLAVLSGAHTLGTAHCPSYADRLYNFSSAYNSDPSLNSEYADRLRTRCKSVDNKAMLSEMDPGSYKTFDTSYYHHVAKRRGLFQSDAALLADATTREYVQRIATGNFDDVFFKDFSESMIKMGNVGVLIGVDGEIRKKCQVRLSPATTSKIQNLFILWVALQARVSIHIRHLLQRQDSKENPFCK